MNAGLYEAAGSRTGDGAQVLHQVLVVHSYAGIRYFYGLFLFVEKNIDTRIKRKPPEFLFRIGQKFELVERVGRVRYQFSEKDLLVRIERMNNQVEKLVNLGLKLMPGHACTPHLNGFFSSDVPRIPCEELHPHPRSPRAGTELPGTCCDAAGNFSKFTARMRRPTRWPTVDNY